MYLCIYFLTFKNTTALHRSLGCDTVSSSFSSEGFVQQPGLSGWLLGLAVWDWAEKSPPFSCLYWQQLECLLFTSYLKGFEQHLHLNLCHTYMAVSQRKARLQSSLLSLTPSISRPHPPNSCRNTLQKQLYAGMVQIIQHSPALPNYKWELCQAKIYQMHSDL